MEDAVNSPAHYKNVGVCRNCKHEIEAIDITENYDFCNGNALKYIFRAGKKLECGKDDLAKHIEDLEKALWYIKREIALRKGT